MALTVILAVLLNLVLIEARTEVGPQPVFQPDNETHFDVYASALSRAHYNPWTCSYKNEPGYKCLSCNSALHCYPGNFALLVQCAGLFPFCRNGYCSRFKDAGCIDVVGHVQTVTHSTALFSSHKDNKTATTVTYDSVDQGSEFPEIHEPILAESSVDSVITESNDPNKVIDGIVSSTNAPRIGDKTEIIEPQDTEKYNAA